MLIEVDTTSPVPAYEQIRSQVQTMVGSGLMPPGMPLAPIRQLAADLGLAVNTVARAYRELERDGVVVSRARHGTVVAKHAARRVPREDLNKRLSDAAAAYALTVKQLGVSLTEAVAAVTEHLVP